MEKPLKEVVNQGELDSKDVYLNNVKPYDGVKEPVEYDELISRCRQLIGSLDYLDIEFMSVPDGGGIKDYKVILNDELEELIQEIKQKLVNDGNKKNLPYWDLSIQAEGNKSFNRTHFDRRLPIELQGTGLGYKIYKAFVLTLGYASSNVEATEAAKRIWYKLVKDLELNFDVVITKNLVLVINKRQKGKLDIVEKFLISCRGNIKSDSVLLSKTLENEIVNVLPVELGGNNTERHATFIDINSDFEIGEKVLVFDVDMILIARNENLARELGATKWVAGNTDLDEFEDVVIKNFGTNYNEKVALVYAPRTDKEFIVLMEGLEKIEQGVGELNESVVDNANKKIDKYVKEYKGGKSETNVTDWLAKHYPNDCRNYYIQSILRKI